MNWPRPEGDNGVGVHSGVETPKGITKLLPDLKRLHIKWIVLANNNPKVLAKSSRILREEGIMPIIRKQAPINGFTNFAYVASICDSPYYLIYNEPGDDREWRRNHRPPGWWEIFREKWVKQAHNVRSVGKHPGLQLMDLTEYHDMLTWMKEQGEESLFQDMWVAPHIYPPLGCPPACTEHGTFDMLGIRDYALVCKDVMGFVPPMIMTESAWTPGQAPPEVRAGWVTEVFEQFRYGTMADGSVLPDWFFGVCFWILSGRIWHGFSWLGNPEDHGATVAAVEAMGEWTRLEGEPEPEPEPEPRNWRVTSEWIQEPFAEECLGLIQERLPLIGEYFSLEERNE